MVVDISLLRRALCFDVEVVLVFWFRWNVAVQQNGQAGGQC